MFKKISFSFLVLSMSIMSLESPTFAENTTTTVETSTQTQTTPAANSKKALPVTTTTTSNTKETTTEVEPRRVIDTETLKKSADTLCTVGFKSYVGMDKKNICKSLASAPDLAYTCVWNKKGTAAFSPTEQGPCNLDFVEHRGSITITKSDYVSYPPLPYGTEVQCCFRAAKGTPITH